MSITFERLGVRMLRKSEDFPPPIPKTPPTRTSVPASGGGSSSSTTGSFLIASFMLYGLAMEGKVSTSMSLHGRLDGIHVQDLTPAGKRYPDILAIGIAGEGGEVSEEAQTLSFSIDRSPQASISLAPGLKQSDVHLFVHVPAIHYVHSVNFVYEMEMFVSDFLKYIASAIASTVKSAAVGVAKGLVSRESQLVRSISMLHTSFGHDRVDEPAASVADESFGTVAQEETDSGSAFGFAGNKLYYDILVQSPVIVIPGSLSREECLVAHLGEITVKNEFIYQNSSQSNTTMDAGVGSNDTRPIPPPDSSQTSVERMTLAISNISLHASHTVESRLKLAELKPGQPCPEKCCRVLREVSMVFHVDKQLAKSTKGIVMDHRKEDTFDSTSNSSADLVITGRVCDPLLIELPKGIFDQLRTTLKHGIRKKPRRKSNIFPGKSRKESVSLKRSNKTVQFDPEVETHDGAKFPTIFASFSLPKLSLELKHVIDSKDRSLVYVSLDDLSVQYQQSDANFLSVDLALKSIIIEDLLQAEDSEYRNILASSSKPLPFPLSPVNNHSGKGLRNIMNLSGLGSPMSHMPQPPFFPLSHLMSTPKPPASAHTPSPLRSFTPSSERRKLFGFSGEKKPPAEPSPQQQQQQDETGSTVKDEASTFSESHKDLLTVRAFYVDKKHPLFKEKYDSVS